MSSHATDQLASNDHSKYLISGDFANFTIQLSDIEWRVHRMVLSMRSGFFQRACAGSFKVHTAAQGLYSLYGR